MRILTPEDYAGATRKLCAYAWAITILYPILGLLSVGLREATSNGLLVVDVFVIFLPFLVSMVSMLGVISALLAIWKGHNRKKAVLGGLGNAAAFLLWFFIYWVAQTR